MPVPEIATVHADGSCSIRGTHVSLPQIMLREIVGSGKSGVVFRGRHKFLNRTVAVKFWLVVQAGDTRDKFEQGIAEARNADSVAPGRAVVRFFDAGEASGYFYAVTDYFPGITVAEWLRKYRPDFGVRRELAVDLVDEVVALAKAGVIHGDLHTRNILVRPPEPGHYADFRIIDFGTSLFAKKSQASVARSLSE
jgi:serine/threonine protein kinase